MKICHVLSGSGYYGKERVIKELVSIQRKRYHEPFVLNLIECDKLSEECEKIGVPVYNNVPFFGIMRMSRGADVIHTHDYKSGLFTIWNVMIDMRLPPVVRTLHGYTDTKMFSKLWWYKKLDNLFLALNNRNVSVNEDVYKAKTIIKNGIKYVEPFSVFDERDELAIRTVRKLAEEYFVFITLARLSEEKNLENLIKSINCFKHLTDKKVALVIAGEGHLHDKLDSLIKGLDLSDRVILLGRVYEPLNVLYWASCYIQPSLTEGCPISVLEAMSIEKPVLLSDVGDMKNINKLLGYGISDTSASGIYNSIMDHIFTQNYISVGKKKLEVLSERSKEIFDNFYSVDVMYREYNEIYDKAIAY